MPHGTTDTLTDGAKSTMNWIVSHESRPVNQSHHFYQTDSVDGLDHNIPGTHFLETRKTSMNCSAHSALKEILSVHAGKKKSGESVSFEQAHTGWVHTQKKDSTRILIFSVLHMVVQQS